MTDRSKASTHADDCWSWGPAHYECAVGEIERLRTGIERLRAEVEALKHRGTLLSNIAYNLAQDDRLPESTRRSLDDARKKWDALRERLEKA